MRYLQMYLYIICVLFYSIDTFALNTYQQCPAGQNERTELDNVCPRLEGKHLPGCCPPLFGANPMTCNYYIVKQGGQAVRVNSSYLTCENGQNVSHECCATVYNDCFEQPVQLQYRPRLISRNNSCCMDACPSANWWINPAPSRNAAQYALILKLTSQHVHGGSLSQCSGLIDQCSVSGGGSCPASSPCPPAGGGVGGGGSGGGSGSGSGTGTG
ncbi:MAG TPA: hypothetical protein PLU50_04375, partial [Pseudobdellovibrionaceae bacterium]|nr:hypothetical protein [Pseudobdellovibrionaceae bacterium]